MKALYKISLVTTSSILNICVKNKLWILADKIILIRKKYIATKLRLLCK